MHATALKITSFQSGFFCQIELVSLFSSRESSCNCWRTFLCLFMASDFVLVLCLNQANDPIYRTESLLPKERIRVKGPSSSVPCILRGWFGAYKTKNCLHRARVLGLFEPWFHYPNWESLIVQLIKLFMIKSRAWLNFYVDWALEPWSGCKKPSFSLIFPKCLHFVLIFFTAGAKTFQVLPARTW